MNKQKIKIYLQYPWKFADSSYYKNLIYFPANNINYINVKKENFELAKSRTKFLLSKNLKTAIRKLTGFLDLPIMNVHLTKSKEKYDLIHCAHCLSSNDSPWVMDLESTWQLWVSGMNTKTGKDKVKTLLLSKNCKKIMPWTEDTKNKLLQIFPDKKIKKKIEIVSHAIKIPRIQKIKHSGINLFFTARYFYEKGGLETLEVFDVLTKKYPNVNAIFISNVPKEILEKYSKNKKIQFRHLIPQKELGYSDSYGFLFIEALAYGLPIVTVDGFARKELVLNGKTGIVCKKPEIIWKKNGLIIKNREKVILDLIKNTEKLIKNNSLRKKMSLNARKTAIEKYSIEKRNKQLERIYQEAIK
ncbi:glycosyltransferase [Candidatus Pacearchaeota archaeon]|nr:glycosyltransferase [Candidatus Pacearchaeota archaeon]